MEQYIAYILGSKSYYICENKEYQTVYETQGGKIMENKPFISIIMPVYNADRYLKDIFNGKKSKSFAEQLAAVKSIFKSSYEQAIQLNSAIAEDTKVKQNEIAAIQTKIDFNTKIAEDNTRYIDKLKELIG